MKPTLKRYSLPYSKEISTRFSAWCERPWTMFLDSGKPASEYGRYDIFVSDPVITLETKSVFDTNTQTSVETEVTQDGQTYTSKENPFDILNGVLKRHEKQAQHQQYPFVGGAVGYFGYDLGGVIEKLPGYEQVDTGINPMMIGIYDWAVVVDHRLQEATLVSYGLYPQTLARWDSLCQELTDLLETKTDLQSFSVLSDVSSNMDFSTYATAFNRIKSYIQAGDCYQVNLAQRFSAKCKGSTWRAYEKLRALSAAPFMAYMHFNDYQILSASPERFLQIVDGHVETRPIKGTRPRDADPSVDQANAQQLQNSIKDRAENLMIVDLLRNDISKHCETGSVNADKLFQLQSFSNVHHLVSIVTGQLEQDKTAIDLLHGAFPGGSITGAPKLRSMEIIEELEPHRRGVYCGSVGYIGFDGNMDTNITIRTAVIKADEISFYAGGGIVADSELEKEYNETLDKAANMLALLKQFSAD